MDTSVDTALELMRRFVTRTGVTEPQRARRYLWTDAFAVCNLLGLGAATGDGALTSMARLLVSRVHDTLGRFRPDDVRTGWLPGADDAHPTRAGLRIGKPLPERRPEEPLDDRLEWDRDGQYFHYLTKWMHALDRLARARGDADCHRWACELASTAHRAFVHRAPDGSERMYWKMSTDLSHPLVPSMGQHDPLDGWITSQQLAATSRRHASPIDSNTLRTMASDYRRMAEGTNFATTDPLGLGGILTDAVRVAQLVRTSDGFADGDPLLDALLVAAARGLDAYERQGEWRLPATHRLAFRELGLVMGIGAADWLERESPSDQRSDLAARALAHVATYAPLHESLLAFWLDPGHRSTPLWSEHQDINDVMLATCLAPDGFVVLDLPAPG